MTNQLGALQVNLKPVLLSPREGVRRIAVLAFFLAALLSLILAAPLAFARGENARELPASLNEQPKELANVGIDEHLGAQVDLEQKFRNEKGEVVALSSFFHEHRPLVLSLAYYTCPSLCNLHINGLTEVFKKLNLGVGTDFDFVVVSINPNETAQVASDKKANYLKVYGREGAEKGWHFLTGTEAEIQKLAQTVGFKYHWDAQQQQYAHASAAYVVTPEGKISRYLYGIDFQPQMVRLSLIEASSGKIGSLVDKLTLFCFHYDPKASKYTLYAMNVMRAGGAAMVLILGLFLTPFWVRTKQEKKSLQGEV